jgi:carbamoyltransferase
MNMHIFESPKCKGLHIFPAMSDDGSAYGAAVLSAIGAGLDVSWLSGYKADMPFWGGGLEPSEVQEALKTFKEMGKINFSYCDSWPEKIASFLLEGKIGALTTGDMEFGPRALGHRSIIALPNNESIRTRINSEIKRRPWYQPLCPSILEEDRERLFEKSYKNKHMTCAFRMKKDYMGAVPSAVHIDGTARAQFVDEECDENYFKLLKIIKDKTGYGVIINTSFNLHGRTMVRTGKDAITDFLDCNLDFLLLDKWLVTRREG